MVIDIEEKLNNYLNLYWLRPENGLLLAFKSKVFEEIEFKDPSIDISCGDGLFMFLHLGGKLDKDFDYFLTTRASEFKHDKFIDIFNTYKENYHVDILKRPKIKINYGTDWKQALLDKANKLDLYEKLILHDNNNLPLPFPENYFSTIYSNSIYWIKNVKGLLNDIYRMLKPKGIAALEVATPYFLETLDDLENFLSPEAINILDRKRRETMPGLLIYSEWKDIMLECGFKIEYPKSIYPNKILIDIWNIGLRPIAHLLIQMSDELTFNKRSKIKEEWVEILFKLLKPLLKLPSTYKLEKAPYILFKLRK